MVARIPVEELEWFLNKNRLKKIREAAGWKSVYHSPK
jgi:hypothetical protein